MRISNLQYIHFFIGNKEYVFSVSSVLTVEDIHTHVNINLKIENDRATEDLAKFFEGLPEEEILIFVGYFDKVKYESAVLTASTRFFGYMVDKGAFVLSFEKNKIKAEEV